MPNNRRGNARLQMSAPIAALVFACTSAPLVQNMACAGTPKQEAAANQTKEQTAPTITVRVNDSGEAREIQTSAKTVAELLKEADIKLGAMDRISVSKNAPVKDGLTVSITRVRSELVTERTAIPFTSKRSYSTGLRVGTRVVKKAGKPGERAITYRDYYKDGVRTERIKLSDKSTKPQNEVVVLGTRGMTLASRGFFGGRRILTMRATGYGPSGNGPWGMRTSSGLRPGFGVVAVDPRFIPLGTRLYIEGYGHAVAGDTGGAIKGDRIDLGFDSDSEAERVGRKKVRVMILN